MNRKTLRSPWFLLLLIALLGVLLFACDDPQCKRYHISIKEETTQKKSMLYCDDYNWLENDTVLELIGCSGHSGTVYQDIAPGDVVFIETFICEEK